LLNSPARRFWNVRCPFSSLASLSLPVRRLRVPTAKVLAPKAPAADLLVAVAVVAVVVVAVLVAAAVV
jgi:hypothetical protein